MGSDNKKTHNDYIKAKGKFNVACDHFIFSKEEIKLLEKYGHWFEALTNGTLSPLNTDQEQFIEVARMSRKPEKDYEKVWFKYIKRKEIESEHGPSLHKKPIVEDDTFYSRDMAKNLKRTMFKVIKENHRN